MPIPDYDDDTFVAYMDISGFKELMKTPDKAVHALDRFYQSGYDVLREQSPDTPHRIQGFLVSDCAILFVNGGTGKTWARLRALLKTIENINRTLISNRIMTTTSVAFGRFSYHQRIEFPGIEKNPLYGNAYVTAYLDNERGLPKIQPGQCRIQSDAMPIPGVPGGPPDAIASRLRQAGKNHMYFYWMVSGENRIDAFESEYTDAYKLKYAGMLGAIEEWSREPVPDPR